jgi:dipeptidyl aminopeptidase/acylaminoacyl peptidase
MIDGWIRMTVQRKNISPSILLIPMISLLLGELAGCRPASESTGTPVSGKAAAPANDLSTARKLFVTKLRVSGPAPQPYQNDEPFPGVKEVEYKSGDLKLKGWLSADQGGTAKQPAVVYLHGGWAFASTDWQDAEPFAKAGYVLFMPTLRGENGNPGVYESFLGEVDDAIAAGRFVSSLPNVDPNNVFVVGHSVGAVLACLTAMLPSPYKAAAAFDGYVDMQLWARSSPDAYVPYDRTSQDEIQVRNPMAFAGSLKCPLKLYAGELEVIPGGHQAMVAPAVQKAIAWFRQKSAS